jgi:D-threo-aldose 1-dehydrogenase
MMRPLGRTGLSVSDLGFGAAGIAGLYSPVGYDSAMRAIQTAWDCGMRYVDTAPYYGAGLSERRVGDFLRDKTGFVLSTKVGKLLSPATDAAGNGFEGALPFAVTFDYSRDAILRSVEMSHARLGLNRIDILFVHDLEPRNLGAAYDSHFRSFMETGLPALDDLKSQGVIAGYGLGVNEVAAVTAVMDRAPIDVLLLAGRYTLLDRSGAGVMARCQAAGTGVVIGGVFNSGILATGAGPGAHFDYGPASPEILARVMAMTQAAKAQNVTLAGAALRFALDHPAVASVLIGSARAESLIRNVVALAKTGALDSMPFDALALGVS